LKANREEEKAETGGGVNAPPPILVLGVGNLLLGDEGVGIHVVQALRNHKPPANIELVDAGTGSLDLLGLLANRDKVIIIDAVKGGGEPGSVYSFTPVDVSEEAHNPMSLHQVSLLDTLTIAKVAGYAPKEIVIFGIEPENIDWSTELSPEVAAVVPKVMELVLAEAEK
jgi:hydrogenase maturation protease